MSTAVLAPSVASTTALDVPDAHAFEPVACLNCGSDRAGFFLSGVDDRGNPSPAMRIVLGDQGTTTEVDPGGWWTVRAQNDCLFEALDDPGIESFSIVAEVRAKPDSRMPTSGVYAGRRC